MYKPYADSTLKKMGKEELMENLRCAEHNWKIVQEQNELMSTVFKAFTDKLIEDGILTLQQINQRLLAAQPKQ